MKTYRVFNIKYDTDGLEIDLPKELILELEEDADPSEELADKISDETSFCVFGFEFEEIP